MKIKSPSPEFFLPVAATVFAADTNSLAIIPLPQKMKMQAGGFQTHARHACLCGFRSRQPQTSCRSGFALHRLSAQDHTKFFSGKPVKGGILLTTKNADTNLGPEGYELAVTTDSVVIRAPTQAGLFYGVQTLFQLLPPEIFSTNLVTNVDWQIPCVQIEDWPRFKWRGLMLDVSRHFFNKAEVETILDAMALHKMNTFHWHLTDDQGWRIEIKKYPKLTQVGAWRPGRRLRSRSKIHDGLRPGRTLRRILHAGRHSRSGEIRGGAAHHHRAGNRNARPRDGGAGGVSAIRLHRRAVHHRSPAAFSTASTIRPMTRHSNF